MRRMGTRIIRVRRIFTDLYAASQPIADQNKIKGRCKIKRILNFIDPQFFGTKN